MSENNVLSFKVKNNTTTTDARNASDVDTVLNFKDKRTENIEEKRRSFERVVFKSFMGTYSVVDNDGSCYPITLLDISYEGCLFEIPWTRAQSGKDSFFKEGKEICLRMYFTEKSYIPVVLTIRHGSEYIDGHGTYLRFGCKFDTTTSSYEALRAFVDFINKFAEHSVVEKITSKAFFL